MTRRFLSIFLMGFWINWAPIQAQVSKIVATDLTRLQQVTQVIAAPDGKKAVYLLRTIEPSTDNPLEYDYLTHIYSLDLDKQTPPKALTRGSSVSNPVFSPDGQQLAFVRAVKGKPQIFILPLDGGEAWQLTYERHGAANPAFSPDGRHILFSITASMSTILADTVLNPTKALPLWSYEKPGFSDNSHLRPNKYIQPNPDGSIDEIRAYLNKNATDKKAKVFNRLNFQGEAAVETEIFITNWAYMPVQEGARATMITTGFTSYNQADWGPFGRSLWATRGRNTSLHPDREQENVAVSLNLKGEESGPVIGFTGKSIASFELSPDRSKMAVILSTPNLLSFSELGYFFLPGGRYHYYDFDRTPNSIKWSPDGQFLYATAPSNGGFPLFKAAVNANTVTRLSDYETGINSFDIAGDKLVMAQTQVTRPSEVVVSDLNYGQPTVRTAHNAWVAAKTLSLPEKHVYKNSKGQDVDFWIMKPTGYKSGEKYPLLLQLHGGPTAMWGPGEFSMWHEFQYFCAQGYGIVYLNQRGSGGYGKTFQFANYRDWGPGPQEDALGACAAAAKEPWVDTARQVITGGSYAGYLTAWIIAHDHRFKAAFAQRGVYDLVTFMGEGNAWRLVPNYFGLPWDKEAVTKIAFNSPYNYVDKIQTPLLIKHGETDLRTGVIQSQMLFRSLKYLGREVEYVLMPGGTHELSRTGNVRQRIDRILRIYEFFERYIGKK